MFSDLKSSSEDTETTKTNPTAQLLQTKGLEHEAAYLNHLKDEGKIIAEIPKDHSLSDRISLTTEAMQSGADVIYQAVLFNKPWRGDADFLIKCDKSSALGDYSYEVLDTKLKQTAEPKHIMQLCVYSELLSDLQKFSPNKMHLFLGDGKKHSFKVSDFLKELSDRIRSVFRDRPRVPWPRSFKQIVVKELSNGKKVQDLSRATGINHQVIRNWQRKTQKKEVLRNKRGSYES